MLGWSIRARACRSASKRAMTWRRVHARLDDLEGDLAADGLRLLGHEDGAHAAFADLLQQLVGADDECPAPRRSARGEGRTDASRTLGRKRGSVPSCQAARAGGSSKSPDCSWAAAGPADRRSSGSRRRRPRGRRRARPVRAIPGRRRRSIPHSLPGLARWFGVGPARQGTSRARTPDR